MSSSVFLYLLMFSFANNLSSSPTRGYTTAAVHRGGAGGGKEAATSKPFACVLSGGVRSPITVDKLLVGEGDPVVGVPSSSIRELKPKPLL